MMSIKNRKYWTNKQQSLYLLVRLKKCGFLPFIAPWYKTQPISKISSWGKEAATSLPRIGCETFKPTQPMAQF